MIEMVHVPAQKILAVRAWGWYVCLLGYDTMNKRKLINSLLKVPEMTFSCQDPQIQIASLVMKLPFLQLDKYKLYSTLKRINLLLH